jgi:hypothetical protein
MDTELLIATAGIIIAGLQTITALLVWKGQRLQAEVSTNIQKIEASTNSMKDALVKATGDAAFSKGISVGLTAKAVDIIQGVQQGEPPKT